ncbi:FlgB family protein [Shimia sp. R11_0]|uniref:Flagellar basal body rod protein FlgB n=1 Tax=Shimia marina TaxID=321267 RepID=A0A0P1EM70_9RHOB|nr:MULTISPECIES: FlgB family protein [Shimia]MBO9476273.1 FlgB family protein [Shimia sp. R11_0]CUH51366.1 flagellar basal body rod protein FlgB [Shimia marina]SFD50908.1 flagellar basal-body rod protein FlgB [Shimia marina]
MFKSLDVFKTAHAMAQHAATRQVVVSQNMANADTPGYQAQDITPFKEVFRNDGSAKTMRATRSGHHGHSLEASALNPTLTTAEVSPNGNSVSLEEEMLKAVEVKRQHDRSMAIYKSSLTVLRTALGR